MNIFGNIFGCCNRYKNYRKTDVDIKKISSERENNLTYMSYQMNNNQNTSLNNNQYNNSKSNNISKFDEEENKSATFSKNNQSIHHNCKNIINEDTKMNKIYILKKYEMKNSIISMSDITFISEKQEKKEENYSKLLLTGDLFFGKEIIITDTGMINGKRNKKDGFTVFGLKKTKDGKLALYFNKKR